MLHQYYLFMLRNYLTIAYRTLFKNKLFSLITLVGFSLGFIPAVLIALYVMDELSFDAFHAKASQIYRITETVTNENGTRQGVGVATQLGPAAAERFPEIEQAVRLTVMGRGTLGHQEFRDYEHLWFADPAFFEVFDFAFLMGDPQEALREPYRVVLTQRLAQKYFGDVSPIGKRLSINWFDQELTVTGVVENFPANSHLDLPLLISASTLFAAGGETAESLSNDWSGDNVATYLLLKPGTNPDALAGKLTALANGHRAAEFHHHQFHLQALQDVHFHSQHLDEDINAHRGNIAYVYIFTGVGCLILLIAFINYINLSTARAVTRSKEVGLRKTVGASRTQLVYQFMGESLLLTLITMIITVTVVQLLLPAFNALANKELYLDLLSGPTLLVLLAVGLLSGVLAGAYPAFYLSQIKPSLLARQRSASRENVTFRQWLVVAQFAMAIVLMTATAIVYQQMSFIRNTDLGYSREQRVTVDINTPPLWEQYESVKAAFQQIPTVERVAVTNRVPGEWKSIPHASVRQGNRFVEFLYFVGDEDFLPTYDISLAAGRNFRHTPADSATVLLNETAVSALGLTDPIGEMLEVTHFYGEEIEQPFRVEVIGVIQDVHVESVREKITPTLITYYRNPLHRMDYYTLQIAPQQVGRTLAAIEAVTQQFDPESPLEYHFLDDTFEEMYTADTRRGRIFGITALLAILIACLGLFALTHLSVEQRTREVGIRKVLGANVTHLTWLISRNFLKLVGIAFLLAAPLAWWSTEYWLQEFAYRVKVSGWLLAASGVFALLIALATVAIQTIKAALANPVDSLRYE